MVVRRKRKQWCRFDVEIEKQICKAYKSGTAMLSIASSFNSNEGTVRNILLHYKVELRRPGGIEGSGVPFCDKYIKVKSGCWEWQFALDKDGYGVHINNIKAHRMAYELSTRRKIPEGLLVCHHCDNPKCVNPDHLFVGTSKDNTQDCIRKKRSRWDK